MPRARLPQLQSITDGSFEPSRRNPVLLGEDNFLDGHQKPIRIGESVSPLSLSKEEIRVNGNFYLEGKLTNPLLETDFEYLELRSEENVRFTSKNSTGSLDLYVTSGDAYFTVSGDDFYFIGQNAGTFQFGDLAQGVTLFQFDSVNSKFLMAHAADTGDNFAIDLDAAGATTITTIDDDGTAAHFTLDVDGDIVIDAASGNITAKDNGGNYTPSSDYHIATKKYVDDNAGGSATGDSGNAAIYDNSGTPAFKSGITKAEVLSLLNVTDGATANAGDVTLAGTQTLTGVKTFNANVKIHGENSRYLYLDDGENVSLTASSSSNLSIAVDGTEQIIITDEVIKFEQNHFLIKERAAAGGDAAGYGQIWIDDAAPNELAFTDDTGTDIVGIGKYHYETKYIGYYASSTAIYLPMTGYVFEKTTTTSNNEYLCFIAPYDGVLEKFCFRSEIAQDGTASLRFLEASNDSEIPSSMTFRKDLVVDIADDTFLDYDLTSPTSGSTVLTKGKMYNIYLSMPTASQDTNVTIVFKWDITT